MQQRLRSALVAAVVVVLGMAADTAAPWRDRAAKDWTGDDARQLLRASPWSKLVHAVVTRRLTEEELREGGRMGQPKGVGYDGVDPKGSGPKLPPTLLSSSPRSARSMAHDIVLGIRWESALPVRLAELKAQEVEPPTLEGEGYRIAVYGIPGSAFSGDPTRLGEPLKRDAQLMRDGKKDVKPVRVEVFPRDNGLVVVYLFPPSAELTPSDQRVRFRAQIGRVVVDQSFELAEMLYQGRLEL